MWEWGYPLCCAKPSRSHNLKLTLPTPSSCQLSTSELREGCRSRHPHWDADWFDHVQVLCKQPMGMSSWVQVLLCPDDTVSLGSAPVFHPLFWDGPCTLQGKGDAVVLLVVEHSTETYFLHHVVSFCINCCPLHKEMSLMRSESCTHYGYWDMNLEGSVIACLLSKSIVVDSPVRQWGPPLWVLGQTYSARHAFPPVERIPGVFDSAHLGLQFQ